MNGVLFTHSVHALMGWTQRRICFCSCINYIPRDFLGSVISRQDNPTRIEKTTLFSYVPTLRVLILDEEGLMLN